MVESAGFENRLGAIPHRFKSCTLHHNEFEEELTSPAPKARARAPISAKSRQGILGKENFCIRIILNNDSCFVFDNL